MAENPEKVKNDESSAEEKSYGISKDLTKKILHATKRGNKKKVMALLDDFHAADIADFIDAISSDKRRQFIELIRDDFNPDILVELNASAKEEVLDILSAKETAKAIQSLDTDDAVDVIEDLHEDDQQEILEAIPHKQRQELEESLAYPEDSAGRLVDKRVVSVPEFWTVGQTIDFLRSEEDLPDEFYQIFISDAKMKPIGGVILSRAMRSKRDVKMKDIMNTDLKIIKSEMDQEEAAFIFRQYGLASAPVVNEEGRMIGVITVDDIVHVMEEEAQEDILHLGGISQTDLHSDFSSTMMKRFPWLLANLITAIIASIVIAFFEGTIEKLAALAVLMPIVASMGGNAGTQTVTVAVRAIATKELTATNAMRVIGKEVLVGGLNGILFAVIVMIISYLWYQNLYLSISLAIATVITLLLAGLAGAVIPIWLVRVGVDPAIASSVVLTTITDVVAFGVFLGSAALILL